MSEETQIWASGYASGVRDGAEAERARIVAWLREKYKYGKSTGNVKLNIIEPIERGEHLK